jgi:hypothetical protein
MIRTMVFLTDFLNAITLLYLFYCQAQAQQKQLKYINQRSHNKDSKDTNVTYSKLIQESENDIKVDYSKELSENSGDYSLSGNQSDYEANVNQFQNYMIKLTKFSSDLL